jgi:hypothetical protein
MSDFFNAYTETLSRLIEVKAQRDELLAALRDCAAALESLCIHSESAVNARAAIAKAEGQS